MYDEDDDYDKWSCCRKSVCMLVSNLQLEDVAKAWSFVAKESGKPVTCFFSFHEALAGVPEVPLLKLLAELSKKIYVIKKEEGEQ